MISWIQRTFQHHFRLIFALLLVGMIVPFIFTIGSTPGIGRADRTAVTAEFFGHNLALREESMRLGEDAHLSATLQGAEGISPEQLQFYEYQRIAALHFADVMHIPQASEAEITEFIKGLRIFSGQDGQFDVSRYDAFRATLNSGSGVSEADIARVIAEDVRTDKVRGFLAGPGYVLPGDVREVLLKGDTKWTISVATVDYSAFRPDVRPTDAELSKFFSDNSFRYTIPPRVSVDYVDFPWQAYAAENVPTDADVRQYYEANKGRFPRPASSKVPSVKADPAADFAAVAQQVRDALQTEKATRSAVKAASDLAYALYESKVTLGASLDSFLASHKLRAATLAPFTSEAGPAELGGSREIANAAFELNADRFYSEGIPSPTGAVVLLWKGSLPSQQPLLADALDKVRNDAIDNEKRKRFIAFGQTLKAAVERRLKAGEPFDRAVAEEAGSARVEVKDFPPFTLRTQPHDIDAAVLGVLDNLGKGGVSDMQPTADKGYLVFAADKKVPILDVSNPRYAQIKAQLAMSFARNDSTAILGEAASDELKRMNASLK